MKSFSVLITAMFCVVSLLLSAQEKSPVKFGKVSSDDFIIKQPFDSGASAVVIADIGNAVLEGNVKGSFSVKFKRSKRIKILNKNGFEAAKEEIVLYADNSSEQKLDDLKAVTYNLENGQVVQTKLDAASVFKDKLTNGYYLKKFTLPAVKEGSIIEISYTIVSDFIDNLRSWYFQSEYPCLWSEYEVSIPEYFNYVTLSQGYLQADVKTNSYQAVFRVTIPGGADRNETVTLNGLVNTRRWVIKNIPALKEENFTSSVKNYVSGVQFQLSSVQFEGGIRHDNMGNWQLLAQKLMDNEYFGASLSKNNGWLDDDLTNVTKGSSGKIEKAQKIFDYVRDNLTCTDFSERYIETSLKDAYKKHSGNVADINLLLIAMLRHEGFDAYPVILSTKDNGFTSEIYPLWQRFNYVVCGMMIDGKSYMLDASSPYNAFGKLPTYCYNGHARVITKDDALAVYFSADSLKEQKLTSVFIVNEEKGGLSGSFKSDLGFYESAELRKKLKGDAAGFFKNIKSGNGFELKVSDAGIDSLKKPDEPASVHYDFAFTPQAEDNIIYFNPMMSEGYKENPFKSADRKYPVEMPYTMDETYLLTMEIPKGYMVDEVPKSVKVAFNTDEGLFEYLIQKNEDNVQMRSRVKLNKATFTPEDYNSLREFFAFVVKKQNEQIVFKKKP